MSNAVRLLGALDERLNRPVELTLYGRAALQLGFANPPPEYAKSMDVDAVFWLGQAEELAEKSNFWEAVEDVNRLFAADGLYISHFFEEDQVVLRADWREQRVPLAGSWRRLSVWRLSDVDLFLTKLMRDDPVDREDSDFIVARACLTREQIATAIRAARVPPIPEIREQFMLCSRRYLVA